MMDKHDHDHNHSNHSGHSHNITELSGKKIFWVTVLNATITISEIVGGLLSGSLSLLSDAVHNLSDTFAIALSYFAYKISLKPKDRKKTFGYKRAEIITAFINAFVLIGLSLVLIFEAIKRFNHPEVINGNLMIIVAFIGLMANLFSVFLLEKDSHGSLNIRSSYLHLLGDTISSVGVVLGGVAIKLWSITWIDPLVTLLISLYIMKEAWHVVKKTIDILMQSSPPLDYDSIKKDIEAIEQVGNIHHIHAWMINENTIHFEAHVELHDMMLSDAQIILDKIEHVLKEHYEIDHVTIQLEINKCCETNLFSH